MSIFRRRPHQNGFEALVQRNSDLPAFAQLPPEFDLPMELKAAEVKARVDVDSGAYDVTAVEAISGQLPYEDENGKPLSHTQLTLQAADLEKDLAAAEATRADLGQILRGEKKAQDETDWSATEPAAPTSQKYLGIILRPERLKLWFTTVGLLIIFGIPEGYVLTKIMSIFIHEDDWKFGAGIAAMLIVFMVVVPYVCGTRLVGCKRRGYANRLDRFVFLGTALWAVFGLGWPWPVPTPRNKTPMASGPRRWPAACPPRRPSTS